MAILGVIEAELQASSRRESGGLGPLFKRELVVAPFATGEFISRTLRAFQRIEGITVANLFVDEEDLLTEEEDDEISIPRALEIVGSSFLDDVREFTVMCAYREGDLTYTVSAEGSHEHGLGDPTFVVLASLVLPAWEDVAASDETDINEDSDEPAPPGGVAAVEADDGRDYLVMMEDLLKRLQIQLDKQLALADPDLRVWDEALGDPTSPARGVEWAG